MHTGFLYSKNSTIGADASVHRLTLCPQTQLSTIPQTQQLQMHAYRISVQQTQCSALVMQSEANHAVLTTIQLGVSTMFITAHAYHERDSFHSLLTRFLWACAAIL